MSLVVLGFWDLMLAPFILYYQIFIFQAALACGNLTAGGVAMDIAHITDDCMQKLSRIRSFVRISTYFK